MDWFTEMALANQILTIIGISILICAIICIAGSLHHYHKTGSELNLVLEQAETNIMNALVIIHNKGEKIIIFENKIRTKINNVEHKREVEKFKKTVKPRNLWDDQNSDHQVINSKKWESNLNKKHDLESSQYNSFVDKIPMHDGEKEMIRKLEIPPPPKQNYDTACKPPLNMHYKN